MFETSIKKVAGAPILIVTNTGNFKDYQVGRTSGLIANAIQEHELDYLGLVVDNRQLATSFTEIVNYITTVARQDKGEGSPSDPRIVAAAYVADTTSLYGLASHFFSELYELNIDVFGTLEDALEFIREKLSGYRGDTSEITP